MPSRRESISWHVDDEPPPPPMMQDAVVLPTTSNNNHTSYGSFPPAIVITTDASGFSSSASSHFAASPRTDRRLRWRAVLLSLSTILGLVVVMVLILISGRDDDNAGLKGASYDNADASRRSRRPRHRDDRLGGEGPAADTTILATAPAAAADPSPPYPSSSPQDPNIKIPVTMGCLEAMCETYMAALGKGHGDPPNLVLLDCIQRTGMSAANTRACFAKSNVTASPLRMGLYQCGVCKECIAPEDAEEKASLCQTSSSSRSSSSRSNATNTTTTTPPPTASNWSQYVPKGGYVPQY